MIRNVFTDLIRRLRCEHHYQYSRSKPGTLVCKRCGARKGRPDD